MIDAVNPDNIGAGWDGLPALRTTVAADPEGECFDYEGGNADAGSVARAMRLRVNDGKWCLGYVNETMFPTLDNAMRTNGLGWYPADLWPEPGVYLFCADPSANVAAGRWKVPVRPIAVQDRYFGTYDLSTVEDIFPAKVLGYIDGPVSKWPDAAWQRFTRITAPPSPLPRKVDNMLIGNDRNGNFRIVGNDPDNKHDLVMTEYPDGHWDVVDVTDAATATAHKNNPGDTRTYIAV